MDNFNQQFLAVVKKLREELAALNSSLSGIQKHLEQIQTEQDPKTSIPRDSNETTSLELRFPRLIKTRAVLDTKQGEPFEWLKFAVGVITLVVVGAYTVASLYQVREMIRATNASEKAAAAAGASATRAKEAIDDSRNFSHLDQRAWLGVNGIGGVPELGQPWKPSIEFRNTGKTPAIDVNTVCQFQPVTRGHEPTFKYTNTPQSRGVVWPNGQMLMFLEVSGGRKMEQSDLDSLRKEDVRGYVYCYLTYEDIFNTKHWAKACGYLRSSDQAGYQICPMYNVVDRNE